MTVTTPGVALRCPSRHWGFALDAAGTLDVRCRDKRCRTAQGNPVVHRFDLETGAYTTRLDPTVPRRRAAEQE